MTGRLLTTREVADRLAVSSETVLRWRRQGTGPPSLTLPGRAVRFPEDSLEAWLVERGDAQSRSVTNPGGRRPHATIGLVTNP